MVRRFTDPWNLETAGVDSARDYYRQQNDADFGNPLAQAVHMAQAAQATTPDPMGLKGLMQALSERNAKVGATFQGTGTPPSTYDPSFQSTSLNGLRSSISKITKGKNSGVR